VSINVILVLRIKRLAIPPGDTVGNVRTDRCHVAMKLAMQESATAVPFTQALESIAPAFTKSSHPPGV
jgi:hypothetical protein